MRVAIGIDSLKRSLAAAAVDELGRAKGAKEFGNDPKGHRAMLQWGRSVAPERTIGIEGCGSFGAGLARFLLSEGEDVREVPANLTHRERRRKPSPRKCDADDAVAVARVVAREGGLCSPARTGLSDDLKTLTDYRGELVRRRTQLINRVHKHLVVMHPGYGDRIPRLTTKKNYAAALALVRGERSARARIVRHHVAEIRRLDKAILEAKGEIEALVADSGTTLVHLVGVGAVTAAKILGEVGSVAAIRSKSAFAMLTGTAPVPASSGQSNRHRLNRGGNRQLNLALHTVAVNRLRLDSETRAYFARQRMRGKTSKDAMRCLKRQLANLVYRRMMVDLAAGVAA
jgi:transposase